MPVKIRLSRKGRKKAPFYHIVAADSRAPRDGKFIEKLGTYNPLTKPATVELDTERAYYWLAQGAQPTETARSILRFKGLLFRRHLDLGVKKGALTQEAADAKFNEWLAQKEAKVAARFEQTRKEKLDWNNKLAGADYVPTPKAKPVTLDEAAEAVEATEEAAAEVVEAATEVATEAVETVTETVVENVGDEDPELAKMNEAAAKEEAPAPAADEDKSTDE